VTTLSTHVLDLEQGRPAVGVRVRLLQQERVIAEQETDAAGRIGDLGGGALAPGAYRLEFDVAAYLTSTGRPAPFLQRASFDLHFDSTAAHYHVPLLMTPYACSTYRGS
jgi:hydroxyisourate hydrolase